MNEPRRIHAQAGRPPPGLARRALDAIVAFAIPYKPNPNDARKFGYDPNQYVTIDPQALADYKIPAEFACIRIGGSKTVKDTKFKFYWDRAKAAKTPRSIYTYNWPGWTVDDHIRNFMESVELWTPGDLGEGPIWADIETHPAGKTIKQISDHAIQYIEALESETGKVVGWYTGAWFVNGHMQVQDWMRDYIAWLATYATGREHPGPPVIPFPIPEDMVMIHQTGSKADASEVGGSGTYDTDRWVGTEAQFQQLFGGIVKPPPDPDLEIRLAHLELRVEKTELEIKQLSKRQDQTDEWGNSYGS